MHYLRREIMAIAIYSNVLDNGGISKFVYNMHHAFQKKIFKKRR